MKTGKIARDGMLVAVAFVLSYVESLLPLSFGVPGIKPGLSNVVVMICLYQCSMKETFVVSIVRIVLSGLTFGSISTMLYSLAGGMLSLFVMYFLKKSQKFSVYGVSMAGGIFHNVGQILVAILILKTALLVYYLPALLLAGVASGILVGILAGILEKRLHPFFLEV